MLLILSHGGMPYPEYAALASCLAEDYDLRRVDDMYHYHFMGKKGAPDATAQADEAPE